jgi:predicted amidophosphoribosyltransferase
MLTVIVLVFAVGFLIALLGPVVLMTCAVFESDEQARRRAEGLCPSCAYSMAGLPIGACCPECGERTEASEACFTPPPESSAPSPLPPHHRTAAPTA